MKEFIAKKNDSNQRLDKYLKKLLPNASTGFLYKMLRKKNITLNGKKANGTEILKTNDSIKIFFSDETFEKFSVDLEALKKDFEYLKKLELKEITIVYEDEDILAASKPVDMLSQKATPNDISANERLIGYLIRTEKLSFDEFTSFRPSICNRLDRNTTGLILMGKSLKGLQYLSQVLKNRTVNKYYLAIVEGIVSDSIEISGYLKKDEQTNKVTISDSQIDEDYLPITTAYRPLETFNNKTLLEVHLITGRSHQIRAHLASIGHPIIGDHKYGNKKGKVKSQLLHAYRIEFNDDKRNLEIIAEPPEIFDKIKEI